MSSYLLMDTKYKEIKMERMEFYKPNEAYDFLNRWTIVINSYETEFQGKQVNKVTAYMRDEKPYGASIEYEDGIGKGTTFISFGNQVLDKPNPRTIDFIVRG